MLNAFAYTQTDVDYFFKTPEGRRLGIQDKEAQQLAYYLLRNRHLDISGHYTLPIETMLADLELEREALERLFLTLGAAQFCHFDWKKECVFIPFVKRKFEVLLSRKDGGSVWATY